MSNATSVKSICDYVKEQIVSKSLFPGNRIAEEELARAMDTSRTTVRSAITRLSYEGFVEMVPNCGAFVAKPTLSDIKQAYVVRTALEVQAVRLAADHINTASLVKLHKNLEAQRALQNQFAMGEYAYLNREFHWEIVKAAGNPYIEKYLNEILNKMVIYLIFYDSSVNNSKSLVSHQEILEAIEKHDARAAEEAVVEDILIGNSLQL
jgi:DNA-binding GntR family transcriptional regulator